MNRKNTYSEEPVLETERLVLRAFTMNDIDDIYEYASVAKVSEFLPWEMHKTKEDTVAFLKSVKEKFKSSDNIDWGIELKYEKKLIGGISIRKWNDQNRCADVGYVISDKYWNKGIATEALISVVKFGFNILHVNRIEAHCADQNIGSYKVMQKVGMKYEGTLREKVFMKGNFINMKFYSILKREFHELFEAHNK